MICPNCRAFNDDSNVFCVSCGESFALPGGPAPTMTARSFIPGDSDPNPSQPTVIHAENPLTGRLPVQPPPAFDSSYAQFQQSFPAIPPSGAQQPTHRRTGLIAAVGILAVLVVAAAAAVGAYLFFSRETKGSETYPTSLGLFFQNPEKTQVTEIRKRDEKSAVGARDAVKKEDDLVKLGPRPSLILYADAKDVPVSDLKLIEIESMKDDGTVRQIEFKAATVEGKQDMKRIWLTEDLASGKYAFAIFDGYFEDGKHHFWPFEVSGSSRKDNDAIAKELSIGRKSAATTPTPAKSATPKPTVQPPSNTTAARVQSSNVILRSGPSQSSSKIGMLSAGQKVYIIEYSDRYEVFVTRDGRALNSNYAYIQTESGKRGWVFAAFIK